MLLFSAPRCTGLRHSDYINKNKNYVCQYCTEYTCLRWNRHVYGSQDSIYCDGLNFWIHRTCAGLSRKEYENLQKYGSDESWYWRPCIKNIFPFYNLSNNQISNLFQTKKKNRKNENAKTDIQCKKPKDCSVLNKRNCRIDKSVICNNCYSPVHRKCSKLKPTGISDLKNGRNLKWECTTCLNNKFPFTFSDDKYIMSNTFNSNFDCRYNIW